MNLNKEINVYKVKTNKTFSKMFQHFREVGAVLVLLALASCGSNVVPPPVTNSIGPSGGTVTGAGGARVVIPEGALSRDTEIAIAQTSNGAPALPSSTTPVGAMFAFTPHGTTFAVPVTITLPFDAGAVPASTTPELLKTNAAQSAFEPVAGATVSGSTMTAQITSFSFMQVVDGGGTPPPDSDTFLDTTFGSGGKVTTDFSANDAVALQQDGKIVMVGANFELARYNRDGSPDGSFGTGGLASTESGGVLEQANAVAIQADGKIIVVGSGFLNGFIRSFALARYNTDGSLDQSFGEDSSGIVITKFELNCFTDLANDVAIQSDGKIVVVGETILCPSTGGTNTDFAIARYNTDGRLDESFDTDGKVTTDFDSKGETANAVALQSGGKIVVAGLRGDVVDDTILARYNEDGSLDDSFGSGGKVTLIDENVSGNMVLQSDDKIVLTGGIASEPNDFLVTRLTSSGDPDLDFGNGGRTTFDFGGEFNLQTTLALQTDGKIVVAGEGLGSNGFGDFLLVRYNIDGTPDTSFGSNGKLTIDIVGGNDLPTCMAVQPDGKIIVGGSRGGGIRLARINP